MFPYIFTYSISCFVLYIGLKIKKNSPMRVLLIFIALLFPAFLAGLRDGSVGADTLTLEHFFEYCKANNFSQILGVSDYEVGFKLYVYAVASVTNNVFWLHFTIELFIVLFVWKSIDENVVEQYKVFAMLLYYLLFYSLNMIRQMMAMSILLFSYRYIKQKKLLKFILCVVISFFIHKASIIGLALYPIYTVCLQNDAIELLKKNKTRKSSLFKNLIYQFRYFLIALCIFMACLAVHYAREIITFAHLYFDDYYQIFYDSGLSATRYTLYMTAILVVTAYTLQFKRTEYLYYFVLFVISLILYQFRTVSQFAYRLSFFLSFYIIVLIPQVISFINKKSNRAIVISMVLVIVCIYSYDFFVLREYNNTYPYTFSQSLIFLQ